MEEFCDLIGVKEPEKYDVGMITIWRSSAGMPVSIRMAPPKI